MLGSVYPYLPVNQAKASEGWVSKDPRQSSSWKLMELHERGADLSYRDPHIPKLPQMRQFNVPDLESQQLTPEYLTSLDCVLIATDHTTFDWNEIVRCSKLLVDTRDATQYVESDREKIWKA